MDNNDNKYYMNNNTDNKNNQVRPESILKFIYPVLLMAAIQFVMKLFAGQLMFFYKGYRYTEGTLQDFLASYEQALASEKFTVLMAVASAVVMVVVFLLWYRREIIHGANQSLRDKCKIKGRLNYLVFPGVLLIAVGLGVFSSYVMYFVETIKPDMMTNVVDVAATITTNEMGLYNYILIGYFVILAPICEELIFRGLTLGFAERKMRFAAANIIQALFFGLLTMNIAQGVYGFVLGLVLGYIYYRTENIMIPIICHMLFNITRLVLLQVNVIGSNMFLFYIIFLFGMVAAYGGVILVRRAKVTKAPNNNEQNAE